MYGTDSLIPDAIDFVLDASYPSAARESELEIVSRPQIEIKNAKKGEDFVYEALIAVRPEVELGEYKGIEVKKADEVVNDDDIASALKSEQEKNARLITVEGRPVEKGDNITLDFEGKIDGVAFDGGKGEDYPLVIGSGTFIPGFEDQIIGHNAGEDFDVNITFPENYQMKDLAGKAAVFNCKVKDIKKKELPELDDDFASEISEFDTLDEYKEDLRKQLSEAKAKRAATENENAFFMTDNLRFFELFTGRVARLQGIVSTLREYTAQVRELYQSELSVKQNRIMTVLTVVTTIIMPLTLITGWYGMNFKYMPELESPMAYPVIIGIVIAIAITGIIYFKKKEWL